MAAEEDARTSWGRGGFVIWLVAVSVHHFWTNTEATGLGKGQEVTKWVPIKRQPGTFPRLIQAGVSSG